MGTGEETEEEQVEQRRRGGHGIHSRSVSRQQELKEEQELELELESKLALTNTGALLHGCPFPRAPLRPNPRASPGKREVEKQEWKSVMKSHYKSTTSVSLFYFNYFFCLLCNLYVHIYFSYLCFFFYLIVFLFLFLRAAMSNLTMPHLPCYLWIGSTNQVLLHSVNNISYVPRC